MTAKYCRKCDTEKDPSQFHRNRCRPDGLADYCKACQIAAVRASDAKRKARKLDPQPGPEPEPDPEPLRERKPNLTALGLRWVCP